jgi:ribonuclease HII
MSFVVGIDEAGRGPLAGPVSVGLVRVSAEYNLYEQFPGLNDSKKLTEKSRERIYIKMREQCVEHSDMISYCVMFGTSKMIDSDGIATVIRNCINEGLEKIAKNSKEVKVFLDGALKAPDTYVQETIIGGDGLIPSIMLASVMAKVERDRLMIEFAKEYPEYGFELHKGYGTKKHIEAIKIHGMSKIHRTSFCTNIS